MPTDLAFWRRLGACESGNNPQRTSASGKYHGAFQFSMTSWASAGGSGRPQDHDWAYQQQIAYSWATRTNPYKQWPTCWPRAMGG